MRYRERGLGGRRIGGGEIGVNRKGDRHSLNTHLWS